MTELNRYGILYVDDETIALKYFDRGFSESFKIFTAPSAAEGWAIIEKHHEEIGILMTDQRMPVQTGVELLEKVRNKYPQIIRILVTAHSDMQSAIDAVNEGAIYKYISKPWDVNDLRITLLRALEFFVVLKERDQLLREKLSTLQQIVLSDQTKNLAVLATGLSVRFRRTLPAIADFLSSAPEASAQRARWSTGKAIGRAIEESIQNASANLARVVSTLSESGGCSGPASDAPVSIQDLFQPPANSAGGFGPIRVEVEGEVSPLPARIGRIRTALHRLAGIVQELAPAEAAVRVLGREAKGEGGRWIELDYLDGSPAWSLEQRIRLFSPFASVGSVEGKLGTELVACFFCIYDSGGRIKLRGTEQEKIAVHVPVDSDSVPEGSLLDRDELNRLFHYERGWEEFLGHLR